MLMRRKTLFERIKQMAEQKTERLERVIRDGQMREVERDVEIKQRLGEISKALGEIKNYLKNDSGKTN